MKVLFSILAFIALICGSVLFLALADIIQWLVHFPNEFTYFTFKYRYLIGGIGLLALVGSLYLGAKRLKLSKVVLIPLGFVVIFLMIGGYAPPYLLFASQHYSAEFKSIQEISSEELKDDAEIMVIEINGDARAYPHLWITQPHVVGDTIGGEDVVLTYCGLSHLGQAYRNEFKGQKLDLKVLTQLENNLVLFDANTQTPINQIEGKLLGEKENFLQYPTTVMNYGSFKKLYPNGKVFYNPTKFYNKPMNIVMMMAIYGEGAQYDMNNPDPEFPTIEYKDKRLPSKLQIYGIIVDGVKMAFSEDFIRENGNVIKKVIGDKTITIKYFPELDFVDAFIGNAEGVGPNRELPDGSQATRYPMYSKVQWIIWQHFHPDTQVNQI